MPWCAATAIWETTRGVGGERRAGDEQVQVVLPAALLLTLGRGTPCRYILSR